MHIDHTFANYKNQNKTKKIIIMTICFYRRTGFGRFSKKRFNELNRKK